MDIDTNKNKISWLGYGAEILTVFFALIVLAGRVYAQSYWNVFGLSAQQIDNNFINYAIMSPNVAVASVLMALGTIFMISVMKKQTADIASDNNSKIVYIAGSIMFIIGGIFVGLMLKIDASSWTLGTPGLVFGIAYLVCLSGFYALMTASVKVDEKKKTKIVATFGWLRNIPFIFVQVIFIIGFAGSSLWGVMDMAQKFGANEAKEMFNSKPFTNIQLDSPNGFQDLVILSAFGAPLLHVKILTEAGGFFYVTPGLNENPYAIFVVSVPVSRVQAIQYNVGATPIGR